jgi:hypothetical protein
MHLDPPASNRILRSIPPRNTPSDIPDRHSEAEETCVGKWNGGILNQDKESSEKMQIPDANASSLKNFGRRIERTASKPAIRNPLLIPMISQT